MRTTCLGYKDINGNIKFATHHKEIIKNGVMDEPDSTGYCDACYEDFIDVINQLRRRK